MSVDKSREELQIGDRVLPTEERRVDSTFFPSSPDSEVRGDIISVFSGATQVGQYDVVILNCGQRKGLQAGNVLAIYKLEALAQDVIDRGNHQTTQRACRVVDGVQNVRKIVIRSGVVRRATLGCRRRSA